MGPVPPRAVRSRLGIGKPRTPKSTISVWNSDSIFRIGSWLTNPQTWSASDRTNTPPRGLATCGGSQRGAPTQVYWPGNWDQRIGTNYDHRFHDAFVSDFGPSRNRDGPGNKTRNQKRGRPREHPGAWTRARASPGVVAQTEATSPRSEDPLRRFRFLSPSLNVRSNLWFGIPGS